MDIDYPDDRPTGQRNRLDALVDEYAPDSDSLCAFEVESDDAIVLVEEHGRGSHWFSLHPDLSAAAAYHLANEDTGWSIVVAVDLRTGVRQHADLTVTWRR